MTITAVNRAAATDSDNSLGSSYSRPKTTGCANRPYETLGSKQSLSS